MSGRLTGRLAGRPKSQLKHYILVAAVAGVYAALYDY